MTTIELMNALPPQLSWYGSYYDLVWQTNTYDSRIVEIAYMCGDTVLQVGDQTFYISAEKHYATLSMLRSILYYSDILLSHLWSISDNYFEVVDSLEKNETLLASTCATQVWEDSTINVLN